MQQFERTISPHDQHERRPEVRAGVEDAERLVGRGAGPQPYELDVEHREARGLQPPLRLPAQRRVGQQRMGRLVRVRPDPQPDGAEARLGRGAHLIGRGGVEHGERRHGQRRRRGHRSLHCQNSASRARE